MAKAKKVVPVKERYQSGTGHRWEYLLCVQDELTVKLREIRRIDSDTYYVYDYIQRISPRGHESTKYGKEMVLREDILSSDMSKGIFKPIQQTTNEQSITQTATKSSN